MTGGRWYFSLFQSKSKAGSGHARFLVCQKKEFPPSALSALSQANFCGSSSTSGSLHLFFNGAGPKLGSLHLFFSGASPKPGALCTFSSKVQAPRRVLLLPELWACKSIEEWFPYSTSRRSSQPFLCVSPLALSLLSCIFFLLA